MLVLIMFASGWLLRYGFLTGWISSLSDSAAGESFDSRISSADLVRGAVAGGAAVFVGEVVSSESLARGMTVGGKGSDGEA